MSPKIVLALKLEGSTEESFLVAVDVLLVLVEYWQALFLELVRLVVQKEEPCLRIYRQVPMMMIGDLQSVFVLAVEWERLAV